MRLALTCNGPGETAGWLRPLLREVYAQAPDTEVHVFYVPDDYATGSEPEVVRTLFPRAHVYDPKTYLKIALGATPPDLPQSADVILYLGGDLMHAARLQRRLRGALATYKFSRAKYAAQTLRAFAVDDANADRLTESGIPRDRITIVGNLAIDGALIEAAGPADGNSPVDGILFMPGSRRYEVEQLIPFFFTCALAIRRERPSLPIAFGISPFTKLSAVRFAVERGGDRRFFAERGTLVQDGETSFLESAARGARFPLLRSTLNAARAARLVVTIPGTKVIELAALGKPVISCTPANAPELVTINGPLTYLDRIPLIGPAAKRAAVLAYSRRHTYHTQPNIDAQRTIVHELHGTLTPGRVARVALNRYDDAAWLAECAQALGALYREHIGAAQRLASALLTLGNH